MIDSCKNKVIKHLEDEFVTDVDGFVYWWPSGTGHHASHHLRWIAEELDSRNKEWNDKINETFGQCSSLTNSEISV